MKVLHPLIAVAGLLLVSGCQSSRQAGNSARESAINMANATAGVAVVRSVKGEAIARIGSGDGTLARVGMKLAAGDRMETKEGGIVDLFLGDNGPIIRVTEASSVTFQKLESSGEGPGKVMQTRIALHKGRILGNVKELPEGSLYEVSSGVARFTTLGGQYDFDASGALTVVSGKANYYHQRQGGAATVVRGGETINPPEASPRRKF